MSVKTAEEKLREMLEGEPLKPVKQHSKKEAQILNAAQQEKREKQEAEAFIKDFEKKLPPLNSAKVFFIFLSFIKFYFE